MNVKSIKNAFCIILFFTALSTFAQSPVKVREVYENIPTYLSGPPEPNPMFFFGRGTQGAEQRIYPYMIILQTKKGTKPII